MIKCEGTCGGLIDETVDPRRYANRLCEHCDPKKRDSHSCLRDTDPRLKAMCWRCMTSGPPTRKDF